MGINTGNRGRNCEEHAVCGTVFEQDSLVRFRWEKIDVDGVEQPALCVYWVTDGVDRCRVGFLQRHLLKHKKDYDGKLAQVVEFLATSESPGDRAKAHRCHGVCRAALVQADKPEKSEKKRPRDDDNSFQTPNKKGNNV